MNAAAWGRVLANKSLGDRHLLLCIVYTPLLLLFIYFVLYHVLVKLAFVCPVLWKCHPGVANTC